MQSTRQENGNYAQICNILNDRRRERERCVYSNLSNWFQADEHTFSQTKSEGKKYLTHKKTFKWVCKRVRTTTAEEKKIYFQMQMQIN